MSRRLRIPTEFEIRLEPDERGYLGRECPADGCSLRYFRITPGTGIEGEAPCHCPYCGHTAGHDQFFTRDQIEYARSVAMHDITSAVLDYLGATARRNSFRPTGGIGFGVSIEVTGEPHPVYRYREEEVETEVVCDRCGLRYAIYGLFGWCPDCGIHNSLQILERNLDLAERKLALAGTADDDIAEQIVADALQQAVSAFDSFGREACRAHADHATAPSDAESMGFQSIARARTRVQTLYGFDFAASLEAETWDHVCRAFQKRHLFAHKGGVVDEHYLSATRDPVATLGRRVPLSADEVMSTTGALRRLGQALFVGVAGGTPSQGRAAEDAIAPPES